MSLNDNIIKLRNYDIENSILNSDITSKSSFTNKKRKTYSESLISSEKYNTVQKKNVESIKNDSMSSNNDNISLNQVSHSENSVIHDTVSVNNDNSSGKSKKILRNRFR